MINQRKGAERAARPPLACGRLHIGKRLSNGWAICVCSFRQRKIARNSVCQTVPPPYARDLSARSTRAQSSLAPDPAPAPPLRHRGDHAILVGRRERRIKREADRTVTHFFGDRERSARQA
jgi:hypothetical protein